MSAEHHGVTILCDLCPSRFPTGRHTVIGARGDAARRGWMVVLLESGKPSGDPDRKGDTCPKHNEVGEPEEDMLPYEI